MCFAVCSVNKMACMRSPDLLDHVSPMFSGFNGVSLMVKKFPSNIPQMYITKGNNETILTQKGVKQNLIHLFCHAIGAYIYSFLIFVLVASSKQSTRADTWAGTLGSSLMR